VDDFTDINMTEDDYIQLIQELDRKSVDEFLRIR
jgi:hypothetical protein